MCWEYRREPTNKPVFWWIVQVFQAPLGDTVTTHFGMPVEDSPQVADYTKIFLLHE